MRARLSRLLRLGFSSSRACGLRPIATRCSIREVGPMQTSPIPNSGTTAQPVVETNNVRRTHGGRVVTVVRRLPKSETSANRYPVAIAAARRALMQLQDAFARITGGVRRTATFGLTF